MGTAHPPILNLRLTSRPDSAGLVRAALGGLAAPFSLRAELVGDVKTVISEACNNTVEHAYRGEAGRSPYIWTSDSRASTCRYTIWGGGFQHVAPAGEHLRVGLPVINALADRAEFLTAPGSWTKAAR